jgi:hypothetical protein
MQPFWSAMMMLPWWAWSVVANVAIAGIEFTNRTGGFANPGQAFNRTWVLILISQAGLFYSWRYAPSFMWAWAVFTSGNIILRVLSSHFLVGETLTWKVGLGVILVLAGGQFVREGIGASN